MLPDGGQYVDVDFAGVVSLHPDDRQYFMCFSYLGNCCHLPALLHDGLHSGKGLHTTLDFCFIIPMHLCRCAVKLRCTPCVHPCPPSVTARWSKTSL